MTINVRKYIIDNPIFDLLHFRVMGVVNCFRNFYL